MPDVTPPSRTVQKPPRFGLALAGMMLVLGLASLDQNIVNTALPRIVSDLGGLNYLSWVVTVFTIAATAATPIYGKLSDMYGRRRLLFAAIAIFLGGSILSGISQSMLQLIVFRGIQGLGAGGLIVLVQAALGDMVTPQERSRYQGLFAGTFTVGNVAGPLIGGILTDLLSWRWIFYVNLPVGAAAAVLIAMSLPRSQLSEKRRVDYAGAILLVGGTVAAILAMTWGGTQYPWGSPVILGMLAATVVLTAAFLFRERVASEPILPLPLFRNRVFNLATGATTLAFVAIMGSGVFLPLYFQLVRGTSASTAGLLTAALMIGLVTTSILGGRVVARTGQYRPLPILGLAIASACYAALTVSVLTDMPILVIELVLVLLGAGLGLVMPNLIVIVQSSVEPKLLGTATSAAAFLRQLGGSFGVAISGALLTGTLHRMLPANTDALSAGLSHIAAMPEAARLQVVDAYRHGIAFSFLLGALATALGWIVATRLPDLQLGERRK